MTIKEYDPNNLETAKRWIHSDAMFINIADALARRNPLSTVRMGDGEKAILAVAKGAIPAKFLIDKSWLKEYGLYGADLKRIGENLYEAAKRATFLCPNIVGLSRPKYEILSLLPNRKYYGGGLYAHEWLYMGRVPELINYSGGVGIVCRNADDVKDRLFMKYGKVAMDYETAEYGSFLNYSDALRSIEKMRANLILISAGPSGKMLCVEAAEKTGKVVLDTGSALIRHWSMSK